MRNRLPDARPCEGDYTRCIEVLGARRRLVVRHAGIAEYRQRNTVKGLKIRGLKPVLFALLALAMGCAWADRGNAESSLGTREAGLRTATGEGVDTAEVYLRWPAPFVQEHVLEPYLPAGGTARWETAVSYWKGGGDHAVVFALGPTIEYPLTRDHWRLSLGIQPTLFSDYESDNRNLGGPFEFTSHIGVRWQANPDWYVGARVQHTSNAGIYDNNPGIDLFAVEIGSRF